MDAGVEISRMMLEASKTTGSRGAGIDHGDRSRRQQSSNQQNESANEKKPRRKSSNMDLRGDFHRQDSWRSVTQVDSVCSDNTSILASATSSAMAAAAASLEDDDPLPDPPRRPLSAYNYFFKAERARILGVAEDADNEDCKQKRKHRKTPGMIGFRELANHVGERWRGLNDEDKAPYQKKFEEDRVRYKKEMRSWEDAQRRRTIRQNKIMMAKMKKQASANANAGSASESVSQSGSRVYGSPVVSSDYPSSSHNHSHSHHHQHQHHNHNHGHHHQNHQHQHHSHHDNHSSQGGRQNSSSSRQNAPTSDILSKAMMILDDDKYNHLTHRQHGTGCPGTERGHHESFNSSIFGSSEDIIPSPVQSNWFPSIKKKRNNDLRGMNHRLQSDSLVDKSSSRQGHATNFSVSSMQSNFRLPDTSIKSLKPRPDFQINYNSGRPTFAPVNRDEMSTFQHLECELSDILGDDMIRSMSSM